ncbi:D-galactonate dehydratase [Variibacter gotjawalensis]|uniref:D-galactonate dehydratase n=1 Tax=Variibacter gotjawalensis TaxID=1333996 RepID=A0A0S3PWA5_9BRAD|nr:mandelate racemase/muconate lactonizing enzyme family protein [Variibacter gotjawalensis]NIK46049.1 L-alanine-DL-glutamate epimerase-like enolase superfamily enzyme [Variibacter gotjawalensis]RZS47967.1 L-alanine-DL-glutamate epimerase-like enolase superfamily enzyme [Variibacter gotjawalensis]BAT60223.1 D-galactonate dehydratase [Variibacter gotjawalensis]
MNSHTPVASAVTALRIKEVTAFPVSFPVAPENSVSMGVGRMVKRDAVIVKAVTEDGLVGYGEAHHGRAHTTVANLINTALRGLILGMNAADVVGVWKRIYDKQLASHGMGAGTCLAMSGIDMALWDIRGKATGWPLYRLLGGVSKPIAAYAGGLSLGYQEPSALVDEAIPHIEAGYKAVKLRIGDTPKRDLQRIEAVRKAFGDELTIMTDANIGYTVEDARQAIPGMQELNVRWLEEPFPPHDYRSYALARSFGNVPLAAGENHYTRYEFNRTLEDGTITIIQPDLSKTGGITEALRIAAMASAYKLSVNPHTSMTGLNMACCIHFLAAVDNAGYFEGDISKNNFFRDELTTKPYTLNKDGTVLPLEKPGIGVEVDERFFTKYPAIEGPSYV